MKIDTLFSAFSATIILCVCAMAAEGGIPGFVAKLIHVFESEAAETSPKEIWRFSLNGKTVFYVPPRHCCDIPSTLYNNVGEILCHPDGGIAGAGDGRCPDFFDNRKNGDLIWKDSRSIGEDDA